MFSVTAFRIFRAFSGRNSTTDIGRTSPDKTVTNKRSGFTNSTNKKQGARPRKVRVSSVAYTSQAIDCDLPALCRRRVTAPVPSSSQDKQDRQTAGDPALIGFTEPHSHENVISKIACEREFCALAQNMCSISSCRFFAPPRQGEAGRQGWRPQGLCGLPIAGL